MALTKLGKTWYDPTRVISLMEKQEGTVQSRYSSKVNLNLVDGNTIIRNLRLSDLEIEESDEDTVHKIEPSERYRPDLLAQEYYNNPILAWVILAANNMKTIFDFKDGIVIRIPNVTSLYTDGGVLSK